MKALHFISGLPRSGSTLLAAILSQNPKFRAGMTGPAATFFKAVEDAAAQKNETSVFVLPQQRDAMLRGVFTALYGVRGGNGRSYGAGLPAQGISQIVFDTSRMWCTRLPVLARLYDSWKMVVCVRDVGWIMDSFERLYRRNGQVPSAIYGWDTSGTVWSRTMALAGSGGVVGYALDAVKEACASEERNRLQLIDYETLCRQPRETLGRLYEFINEPWFDHDFSHVAYEAGEFDRQLGAPGLHTVSGAVEWRPRETILPPDLFARFANDSFWRP